MIDAKIKEKIAFAILLLLTMVVILPVILILLLVLIRGLPRDGMRAGGIFPAIVGTVYLTVGTAVFSIPLGILAAIYLNEYAQRNWLTRLIELAIINLAGVPSIVYGLFGLGLFVTFLNFGASILAGSLTLALSAVPRNFREVSFSLGASRWQTVRHVVLPNAIPGILTGTILGLSRAAGETAPILFTVAAFYLPRLPQSISDQAMVLPYHIYVLSTQVPNVSVSVQYGTVLVLVGMVFIMNILASWLRAVFRRRKTW
jgi:phosphate transport system permease protein